MLHGSNGSRNSSYLVPCVFKAVQMIEALRETRAGLRAEDFLRMTGFSRSTIYRILRTLIACGYIARDRSGFYHLNHAVITVAEGDAWSRATLAPVTPWLMGGHSNPEFERWGVRFRHDGRRAAAAAQPATETAGGSLTEA
jgi:hypothetical protein